MSGTERIDRPNGKLIGNHMDFEDLMTGGRRGKHGYSQNRHGHEEDRFYRGGHDGHFDLSNILAKAVSLTHFKTILIVAVLGVVLIAVLGIVLLMTLIPLLSSAFGFVAQNGVQGVVNSVVPDANTQGIVSQVLALLQGLWKGNG